MTQGDDRMAKVLHEARLQEAEERRRERAVRKQAKAARRQGQTAQRAKVRRPARSPLRWRWSLRRQAPARAGSRLAGWLRPTA